MIDMSEKKSFDIATMFRFMPWAISGDKRDPSALIARAASDTKGFLNESKTDDLQERKALLRGLTINFFNALGVNYTPDFVEHVVNEVTSQTDKLSNDEIDLEIVEQPKQ